MKTFFQIKPPDIVGDLSLANKLHKLANSLDNDAFVKRNLLALSDVTSRNELKAFANTFALNTADDHDNLHHERKRRFWNAIKRTFNRAREHARRIAAAIRRKARRLALAAKRRAQRIAAAARRKARLLAARARRLALAAKRKALAFVNKIKNKFGGFSGVINAFRIGFLKHFTINSNTAE